MQLRPLQQTAGREGDSASGQEVFQAGGVEEAIRERFDLLGIHGFDSLHVCGRQFAEPAGELAEGYAALTFEDTFFAAFLTAFFAAFPVHGAKNRVTFDVDQNRHSCKLLFHYHPKLAETGEEK